MTTATVSTTRPSRPGRCAARSLAIFDLDRTLVPGSTLMELGRALAQRGVIGRTDVARHIVKAELFSRRGLSDSRITRLRQSLLAAAADRELEQLISVAREVGPQIASGAYPAARWLLERHHAAGDLCVVLSASPQELVEVVAAALGADRAVGTRTEVVSGRLTGRLDGPFCHGEGKLERLREEMGPVDLARAFAYADSGADLPLLGACGGAVAVNPDRRLRQAAAAAGWPVLRLC
ncbi:MAG: HAD-IB family hydrolase [Actinobacteria bacterium]|nr:HAD-IB family hydrolase [Actinomycetota bacterium]